jgi:Transposase domain (DUF772)
MTDRVFADLSPRFTQMYSAIGRPSIPPEQLLRALLLQSLYTVRSERLLTTIIEGPGTRKAIEGRVKQIRAQIDDTTADYDHEKLQERLAKLVGGVAVIKVGAATETEMKEKKARVEDALHATKRGRSKGNRGTSDQPVGVERVSERGRSRFGDVPNRGRHDDSPPAVIAGGLPHRFTSWRQPCRRGSALSATDRTRHSARRSASTCRRLDLPCIPTSFLWRRPCRRSGWPRLCRACPTEN